MSTRAERLRAKAARIEAAELKAERLKTADKIPTCPECGGRSFKVFAWTVVSQSMEFPDDVDDDGEAVDGEWSDDYESGDHTDQNESATCNNCGADVQEVLEAFKWTFYDPPEPRNEPAPVTSIESQTYIDGGNAALHELRKDQQHREQDPHCTCPDCIAHHFEGGQP